MLHHIFREIVKSHHAGYHAEYQACRGYKKPSNWLSQLVQLESL